MDGVKNFESGSSNAFEPGPHCMAVEGATENTIDFTVSNINDEDLNVNIHEYEKPVTFSDPIDVAYYRYEALTEGDYVIQRSNGGSIYAISEKDIVGSSYDWKYEDQAISTHMTVGETYYIAIPYVEVGEKLTIGIYESIKKIEINIEGKEEQNASEVLDNGFAYSVCITYENDEGHEDPDQEVIPSEIIEPYNPIIQARNGEYLYVSYWANGKELDRNYYSDNYKIPIDSDVTIKIANGDKELASKQVTIVDDFKKMKDVEELEIGEEYDAAGVGPKFYKLTKSGEYRWQGWNGADVYNLKDGYMTKDKCYGGKYFTTGEIAYINVLAYNSENHFYIERLNAIKTISAQSNSMQFVEGKYSLDEDEDKIYMDLSGVIVEITYEDGSSQNVSVDEWIDSEHNIYYELYEAKSGQPDYNKPVYDYYYSEVPAGAYILEVKICLGASVDAVCNCYIPITVVHDWGTWTTSKKADINSPETQTSKCAHCGTVGTRTIGSKLAPVLTLTDNKLTMKTKQSTSKFKVEAMAAGDTLATVTSSNTKLLKVSNVNPNGTFKLKAQGKTGTAKLTITLKSGLSKTIKVKIQKAKVKTTKIKVASKKLTLSKKQKYNLAAVVMPVTSYDKVKYTTSNKKVATVNKKGQITAKGKGKATITVKSGKKSVKVKVTVK